MSNDTIPSSKPQTYIWIPFWFSLIWFSDPEFNPGSHNTFNGNISHFLQLVVVFRFFFFFFFHYFDTFKKYWSGKFGMSLILYLSDILLSLVWGYSFLANNVFLLFLVYHIRRYLILTCLIRSNPYCLVKIVTARFLHDKYIILTFVLWEYATFYS